jgi:hypothetical protein
MNSGQLLKESSLLWTSSYLVDKTVVTFLASFLPVVTYQPLAIVGCTWIEFLVQPK